MPSQIMCGDGRMVNSGLPPRRGDDYRRMLMWLDEIGGREQFPEYPFLEIGAGQERIDLSKIQTDPEVAAIFGAGRECVNYIASKLSAFEFFTGAQERGFQVGIIYSPEEVMEDPHFKARGFPVEVEHPEHGHTFTYPGAPYAFGKSRWAIERRAPLLGEDTKAVLG